LEAYETIVMGVGTYVDPNLLSKMEVFIKKKKKKSVVGLKATWVPSMPAQSLAKVSRFFFFNFCKFLYK